MSLLNWLYDLHQRERIQNLERMVQGARVEAGVRSRGEIDAKALEQSLAKLSLAVRTLHRVLVTKGVCTAEEIQRTLRQVDLDDGRENGR